MTLQYSDADGQYYVVDPTPEQLAARVAEGAKFLDQVYAYRRESKPWYFDVDLDALDLQSAEDCVLAQVAGGFFVACGQFFGSYQAQAVFDLGFDLGDTEDTDQNYAALTAAWRDLLISRQH